MKILLRFWFVYNVILVFCFDVKRVIHLSNILGLNVGFGLYENRDPNKKVEEEKRKVFSLTSRHQLGD